MNQVSWILVGWVAICIVGIIINVLFLVNTIGDHQFLKQHNLNGVREALVRIHFTEAFSHLVVKLIFALMGLWSLALRSNNNEPLTFTGWLVFGTFYLILILITLTDIFNFNTRTRLVQKLFSESIVYVPMPETLLEKTSRELDEHRQAT